MLHSLLKDDKKLTFNVIKLPNYSNYDSHQEDVLHCCIIFLPKLDSSGYYKIIVTHCSEDLDTLRTCRDCLPSVILIEVIPLY